MAVSILVPTANPGLQTCAKLSSRLGVTVTAFEVAGDGTLTITSDVPPPASKQKLPGGMALAEGDLDALVQESQTALHTHAGGSSLPAGIIVMWSGLLANIPSGWLLCDGTGGTPDLRSRFIKGAAAGVDPGVTGGAATHTHAGHANHVVTQPAAHVFTQPAGHSNHVVTQPAAHTEVMNHTHPVTDPGHVHDEYRNSANTGALDGWAAGDTSTNTALITGYDTGSKVTGIATANPTGGVASITHSGAAVDAHSAHAGGAVDAHSAAAVDAHSTHDSPNSEPPYYSLAFIMKS